MNFFELSREIIKSGFKSFFTGIFAWVIIIQIILATLMMDASFLANTATAGQQVTIENGTSTLHRGINIFFHGSTHRNEGYILSAHPETMLSQIDLLNEKSSGKSLFDILANLNFDNKTTYRKNKKNKLSHNKLQYSRDPENIIIFDLLELSDDSIEIYITKIR